LARPPHESGVAGVNPLIDKSLTYLPRLGTLPAGSILSGPEAGPVHDCEEPSANSWMKGVLIMRSSRNTLLTLVMIGVTACIGCGHASNSARGGSTSAQRADNSAQPANNPKGPSQPAADSARSPNSEQAADQAAPPAGPPGPTQPATYQVTIPDGTPIVVRLQESLGSARSEKGEVFHATLATPLVVNGEYVVPSGTKVSGRVLLARPSGHLETPAELSVTLTSFEVSGHIYPIVTSHRSWRSKSHKKHNAKWIAGASGAGALIGALVGHGGGALIGGGIGAGGGTAAAYATGEKNIVLRSETRLRFILRHPVTVTESRQS
jgi:hypothetical protein